MKRLLLATALTTLAFSAFAKSDVPEMGLAIKNLDKDGRIQPKYAFCQPAEENHTKDGGNFSPELLWTGVPDGVKSFAIIMVDPDVPTDFSNANKEEESIPADMKRQDFYHWVLVNIDPATVRLPAGADSDAVDPSGKQVQKTKYGMRGLNSYGTFKGGNFYGYDGPCPPWNDMRMHHYTFSVYALDVKTLDVTGGFTAKDALKAMEGHVLAKGSATGLYSQNPSVAK